MPWDLPMPMAALNLSATLNIFRLIATPSLCLPHATVSTFNDLPLPLGRAFEGKYGVGRVNVRAVVLDKDDCFAVPGAEEVFGEYKEHFSRLRQSYPSPALLIVSNTAGSTSSDPSQTLAKTLTANTEIPVLRHKTKKPGCGAEIMEYFRAQKGMSDLKESEVVVIGDRLLTDMMLANMMGSWGLWIQKGVVGADQKSIFTKLEQRFAAYLIRRGCEPPTPTSPFE